MYPRSPDLSQTLPCSPHVTGDCSRIAESCPIIARKRALSEWDKANPGATYDPELFRREILPRLGTVPLSEIIEAAGCSKAYASDIRRGKGTPHVSAWVVLGALVELDAAGRVRSMIERSSIWLSPQGLSSFLRALTGALPRRWPRSAPPGQDGGQGLREGEEKMSTDQPTEAGTAYHKTVDQAQKAYDEELAPDKKAYDEALDQAEKAYDEAMAPVKKAYDETVAPAEKAYEEAVAPAKKAYDEAVAPARKAYDKAVAPASKAYNEAMASAAKAYDKAMAPAQKAYDQAGSEAEKTYDEAMAPDLQGLA